MVRRLGLSVGDSFAETRGSDGSFSRWFLPKKSLSEGLREALKRFDHLSEGGELIVALSRAEAALERKQGSAPALFVTNGFESWARARRHAGRPGPALQFHKSWSPVPDDQVFGIDEKISVDGTIEKPLKLEELEFLVAKLELQKIKDVAIYYRHSHVNPAHEIQTAQYLRERGLRVVASHTLINPNDPTARPWARAIDAAYVESVVLEDINSIRQALEAEGAASWTIKTWTWNGLSDQTTAAHVRGGTQSALSAFLTREANVALVLGLEEFVVLERATPDGKSQVSARPAGVQPTCQIESRLWPFPTWTALDRGYEPGPMLFGKSHQLTLLDVLFVGGRFSQTIEAFSDRVQDKSAPRILETLFTLGKNLAEPGMRAADPKVVAANLERAAVERIALDLAHLKSKTVVPLYGPLASTFAPLLEKRRPDLDFKLSGNIALVDAVLGGSTT